LNLIVTTMADFPLDDTGLDLPGDNTDWDDTSPAQCGNSDCQFRGVMLNFKRGYEEAHKNDPVAMAELWVAKAGDGDNHPEFTAEDWRVAVASGGTRQSYAAWVLSQAERKADEDAACAEAASEDKADEPYDDDDVW
jgi:hypothetical protein